MSNVVSDFLNSLGKEHGNPVCPDEYVQGANRRIRGQRKTDNRQISRFVRHNLYKDLFCGKNFFKR